MEENNSRPAKPVTVGGPVIAYGGGSKAAAGAQLVLG
ncbi:MAG: hypothetical protein CM15mP49_25650 [Actinomycetota bacterium]|nr:MAG: hypothetical protein CM15mP49_25650 [Actinomycetota bacterium]